MKIPKKRKIAIRRRDLKMRFHHMMNSFNAFHRHHPFIKKIEIGTATAAALLLFLFLLTDRNPFEKADIYPKDNASMTAGTVTVTAQENKAVFMLTLGQNTKENNLSLVNHAYAQNEQDATLTYQAGSTAITSEVRDPDGNIAENTTLSITPSGDDFALTVEKSNQNEFRPGVYKLYTTLEKNGAKRTITQNFAWGVLAINSLKSVYTKGEEAIFHFGVLDEKGNTLCNAKLAFDIRTPSGKTKHLSSGNGINNSSTCQGNSFNPEPDYWTKIKAEELGTYKLTLMAETANGKFTIDDELDIVESVPFDVERTIYPTRIYPDYHYGVEITVKANQDYTGGIIESVPSSFGIVYPDDSAVPAPKNFKSSDPSLKKILWPVKLKKGQTTTLSYGIDFPNVSPEFYLVGPLQFNLAYSPDSMFTKLGATPPQKPEDVLVFEEKRMWQIASDAVVVSGGITTSEAQFAGNQRKVAYVNSNWYAFYNDDGNIYYKKSSNGTTWGSAVDMDSADAGADDYNPAIAVSNNIIHVFWIDDGSEVVEGRRINTASSDAQGTLCQTSSLGTIGSSFTVGVAAVSDVTTIVGFSDTSADTEVDLFEINGLDGTCSVTDVHPGNIQFGTQNSGLTAGDRPEMIGVGSTAMMIFQNGTTLKSARYDHALDEWRRNNQSITASDTNTMFSTATDGTNVWVLSASSTSTNLYHYPKASTGLIETSSAIDSDVGAAGDEQDTELDIWCPPADATNCKIVYVDNLDSNGPDLTFIDCNSADCSSFTTPTVLDSDTGSSSIAPSPAMFCVASDDCKIMYTDILAAPDLTFIDCTADEDCSTNTQTDVNTDLGTSASGGSPAIYCVATDNCKFTFFEDDQNSLYFGDCGDATCSGTAQSTGCSNGTRTCTVIGTNINTTNINAKSSIYCVSDTDCKVVFHDAVNSDLTFIDCADAVCSTQDANSPFDIDGTVGETGVNVPSAIDCVGGSTDCKVIYADANDTALFFVDCDSSSCNSSTITTIDDTAGNLVTFGLDLNCVTATDCKGVFVGNTTSGSEDQYFFDCDNATCTSGSVVNLDDPPTRAALSCPTTDDCKIVYYDTPEASQPVLRFADCTNEDCLTEWESLTAPWTSETNIQSVSLTYDSTNTDLIASIVKDASETAYYNTSDSTTISWGGSTAYDGFSAAGDMDNISTPRTVAGTGQMGALVRQGSNMEFDKYAATVVSLSQNYYRFRDDTTALNTDGGYLEAQNTDISILYGDTSTIRLRFELANLGDGSATNYDYRIEYAENPGSCSAGTYATVPATATTEPFEMVLSDQYVDLDAISSSRLTATGSFVNGIAVEDSSTSTGNHTIAASEYSEFEYAIAATSNAAADNSYCFRLTNAGSTTNFTYSVYPQINITPSSITETIHWGMDEGQGSTLNDRTGNGNTGTLGIGSSAPSWKTKGDCIAGNCLYFDGTNDYVTANTTNDEIKSVSFWIRPTSTTDSFLQLTNSIYVSASSGTVSGNGFTNPTVYVNGTRSTTITANQWNHITVTSETAVAATAIILGNNSTAYYDGFMDEVKFFPDTLSESQVKGQYAALGSSDAISARFGPDTSFLTKGLVGWWKLDESSGNASDSSGAGLTLTNNGTTTYVTGKFANGSEHVPASSQYLSTATTVNGVKSVSFWVNPDNTTNYYISLTSSAYITSSSGTLSATGFTNPTIYVNGVQTTTIAANTWQFVTVVSDTAINADTFYIGRQSTNYFDGTMDEARLYNRALSPAEVRALYSWAPGPVAYYRLDENADITANDISTNGNTGTLTSGPTWTAGKYGGAIKFDGTDDYVAIADSTTLDTTKNAFTLTAWIYDTDVDDTVEDDRIIIGKGDSGTSQNNTYRLRIHDGKEIRLQIADGTTNQNIITTTRTVPYATWTHVAAVYDGTNAWVYINGILDTGPTARTVNALLDAGQLNIGRASSADCSVSFSCFDGRIDDVRIYNYPRTAGQIIEDMNGVHPAPGSPVGSALRYWKFDEGYGSTVNNTGNQGSTYNGSFGTGSSAPTWTTNGKLGSALIFDRNDYVNVGDIDLPSTLTFSAWIKPDATPVSDYNAIITKRNTSIVNYGWDIRNGTDEMGFYYYNAGWYVWETSDANITTDWTHVLVTFDGVNPPKFYVNGVKKKSSQTSGASIPAMVLNDVNTYIGGGFLSAGFFDGFIDEFKIYNFVLTEDEIKAEYNQGKAIVLGSLSTGVGGTTPSWSQDRSYCVPGDTSACNTPVGEWKLDEKSGTSAFDTSGNGNTGTINGAIWSQGKFGNALNYDGNDDYITVTDNASLDFGTSTAFSTSFWVKMNDDSNNDTFIGKIREEGGSADGGWRVRYNDAQARLEAEITSDTWNDYCTLRGTTTNIENNQWHYITVVFNRNASCATSDILFYINGNIEPTSVINATISTNVNIDNDDPLIIGAMNTSGGYTNDTYGVIDNIKLYNYARTPAQIAWDYNQGAPIAWYRLDECTGSTAYNAVLDGNGQAAGNNGTITIGGTGSNTSTGSCSSGTGTEAWNNGTTGKINSSLDFDGTDDYVLISDNAIFETSGKKSVALWMKADSVTTGTFASKYRGSTAEDGWIVNFNGSSNIGGWIKNDAQTAFAPPQFTGAATGTWYHVVMTWDTNGGTVKLYVNGKYISQSSTISGTFSGNTRGVSLGRSINSSDVSETLFNGKIDDVRIYNYELTPTQVKEIMNNGAVSFK